MKSKKQRKSNQFSTLGVLFPENYAKDKVYLLGQDKYQFLKASCILNQNKDDSLQIMSVRIYKQCFKSLTLVLTMTTLNDYAI